MSLNSFLPKTKEQVRLLSLAYKFLEEGDYESAAEYFVSSSKSTESTEETMSESEFLEALSSISSEDYSAENFKEDMIAFEKNSDNLIKELSVLPEEF